jgi:hypothetical protein
MPASARLRLGGSTALDLSMFAATQAPPAGLSAVARVHGITSIGETGGSATYAHALEDALGKIEFRHFPYPPTWRVRPIDAEHVTVEASWHAADRDTGEPLLLKEGAIIAVQAMEPEDVVLLARSWMRTFVLHEVDETLRIGEARPFDPHAKTPR